ncbi:MAG: hypothetical protein A2007_02830 [Verrucomicrobia bacterium GWC2_42_7]|nr:MAG: hypothetical protein A2007_02830 [Verrucomicrobia bacterium GWC2_42_7]
MKVGLTGASGVLGTIVCQKLAQLGVTVSCFTGDLCSKSDIHNWLHCNELDSILHLAALVPTNLVKEDPLKAFDVNVGGTINLLTELSTADLSKRCWFFYASTSHVYKSSDNPITERNEVSPVSLYGKTKQMAEDVVIETGKVLQYNLEICIGRIFSFYHKTQRSPFLYPTIIKRLEEEDLSKPFFLHGADSVRDFLNAEEVVDIIIALSEKRTTGIYNIASGKGIKIRDFVQSLTPTPLIIKTNQEKDSLVADISKLKSALI